VRALHFAISRLMMPERRSPVAGEDAANVSKRDWDATGTQRDWDATGATQRGTQHVTLKLASFRFWHIQALVTLRPTERGSIKFPVRMITGRDPWHSEGSEKIDIGC